MAVVKEVVVEVVAVVEEAVVVVVETEMMMIFLRTQNAILHRNEQTHQNAVTVRLRCGIP
jgi:hypothetical protein